MQRPAARFVIGIVAAFALAFLAIADGCDDVPTPPGISANSNTSKPAPATSSIRIVSFSPAISDTLLRLGLQDAIVGRTPYCRMIDEGIPIAGDLTTIDYETLIRLNPTHIFIQPPSSGIEPRLVELADEHGWTIGDWHLDELAEIDEMARDLPELLYADDDQSREALADRVETRLTELAHLTAPPNEIDFTGDVLLVCFTEPITVFGHDTYLHELLAAAGVDNACDQSGWVQLSLEDVIRLAPDAVILVRDQQPAEDQTAIVQLGPIARADIPAIANDRFAVLYHPRSMLPSLAVIEVAEELRRILTEFAQMTAADD